MPNVIPSGTLFQRRINNYVPAMQYAMDVNINGACRVSFGAPPAGVVNNILNAQAIPTGPIAFDATANVNAQNITVAYGRSIQVLMAGATNTGVVQIRGGDYLGQAVEENVTAAGGAAVESKKAFKYVDNITCLSATAATTLSVGWGTWLGLPYKAYRVAYEIANGVLVGTTGGFIAGGLQDPQGTSAPDPRGLFRPTTVLNGANIISAVFDFSNDVNSSNNGGLHGIKHFFA
jgi:hypothetical protein